MLNLNPPNSILFDLDSAEREIKIYINKIQLLETSLQKDTDFIKLYTEYPQVTALIILGNKLYKSSSFFSFAKKTILPKEFTYIKESVDVFNDVGKELFDRFSFKNQLLKIYEYYDKVWGLS